MKLSEEKLASSEVDGGQDQDYELYDNSYYYEDYEGQGNEEEAVGGQHQELEGSGDYAEYYDYGEDYATPAEGEEEQIEMLPNPMVTSRARPNNSRIVDVSVCRLPSFVLKAAKMFGFLVCFTNESVSSLFQCRHFPYEVLCTSQCIIPHVVRTLYHAAAGTSELLIFSFPNAASYSSPYVIGMPDRTFHCFIAL